MTKTFKQMYSNVENRNNTKYNENDPEVDFHQLDPQNMDTFLNLEDTFIESKKNYGGKMGSNVIVGKKEKHLEIQRFNYMTAHIEPGYAEVNEFVNQVGFIYDSNMNQKPRFVEFPEKGNFMKVKILKDGIYKLTHKEELNLDASDREVFSYINRVRDGQDLALCVYHIQGNVSKTLNTSGTDPNGTVAFSLTLGEMHPRLTGFCSLYSELKAGDTLEYRILGNKTDLNDANRVSLLAQTRDWSNFWQVEYVNFAFDDLNKGIKQHLIHEINPTP